MSDSPFAVVPVLVGPLQVLLTVLPGVLLALLGGILTLLSPRGMASFVKLLWRQKLAVVLLAGISIGTVFAYRALFSRSVAAGPVGEKTAGTDWTTARFNLRRLGAVPGSPGPLQPQPVKVFRFEGEAYLSSPAVVGNRVYVATAELGFFDKSKHVSKIICLDADTLNLVWESPPLLRATFSSPVIAGDVLVCGEGLHETRDARVVCLDLRSGNEGNVLWTFETKNHVECTPAVWNGRVYVGAGDDGIYCLDLKPDADGKPKVHWHAPTEEYPDAETALAVHEGKVYFGLGKHEKGKTLVVLDALTGKEVQRRAFNYPIFSPPAIVNGKIYLGMGEGDYREVGEAGRMVCLDLKTLKTDWSVPLGSTLLGAVAVAKDKVYFGACDGHLYARGLDGSAVAKFNSHAPIKASPAVTEHAVYIVNDAGHLFALDRHTLEPLWEYRLGTEGMFVSSPVVAHGRIYVGTEKDGFLCLGSSDPAKKEFPRWSYPGGDDNHTGNADGSPLPAEPELLWTFPGGDQGPIKTAVAAQGKDLFVAIYTGKDCGIACLPAGTDKPTPRWHFPTPHGLTTPPVVLGDLIAFLSGPHLIALDRATGEERWNVLVASGSNGLQAWPTGDLVVVGQKLQAFSTAGKPRWELPLDSTSLPPPGNHGPLALAPSLVTPAERGNLRTSLSLLDGSTGLPLWSRPFDGKLRSAPLVGRKQFYLGTQKGLEARALVDGTPLETWKSGGGPVVSELVAQGRHLLYLNDKSELVIVRRDNGEVVGKVPDVAPGIAPVAARNLALVATKNGLATVDLDQKEPTLELWLAAELEVVGPMVAQAARVYVPTKRGLICVGRKK